MECFLQRDITAGCLLQQGVCYSGVLQQHVCNSVVFATAGALQLDVFYSGMFVTGRVFVTARCLLQHGICYSGVFCYRRVFVTGGGGGVAVAGCMLRRNVGYSFLQHDICYSGEFVTAGFYSEVFVTETYEDAHWQTKM